MFAEINNIKLYYETKGSGRPLIMVHGNSEDHTIFNEASEILKDHFQVYLIDSRDHGQSSRTSALHYEDMRDDMLAFMEALDLSDVIFYGFSDGGIIGLLAAMKTDRITKLITSGANITPDGVTFVLKAIVKVMYFFNKDKKLEMILREPNITKEQLGTIKVPTTVIAGEKDMVKLEETKIIAQSIPNSKLRILPKQGHGSYIVHKTEIADIILEETK